MKNYLIKFVAPVFIAGFVISGCTTDIIDDLFADYIDLKQNYPASYCDTDDSNSNQEVTFTSDHRTCDGYYDHYSSEDCYEYNYGTTYSNYSYYGNLGTCITKTYY